jgi:predicted O-methyltransferase YrrM
MEKIKKNMSCSGQDCFENDHFNSVLRKGEISHLSYLGLSVEQNPNILYPFYKLISQIKPKQILEIGTFAGGLTLILRDLLDENGLTDSELLTYDVNSPNYLIEQVGEKKIEIKVKNLFSDDYQSFRSEEEMNEISNFIQKNGQTIVLCDGGSKKTEFNIIAPLLKEGDIIMAHDYCYDGVVFENKIKGKYWNWLEINNSDIEQSCLVNNLVDYLEDDFDKVAWACKIKRK